MSKLAHSNQATMDLIEAHRLAEYIGWQEAKELAAANSTRRGFGQPPTYYYDHLAATCLGNIIYTRMTKGRKP